MGGEVFADSLRAELQGYYDQSGEAIGRAFVRQAEQGLSSGTILKINGVDYSAQVKQSQNSLDFQSIAKSFSDSVSPLVSKIEQASSQLSSGNELSSHFSGLIGAMQKLQAGLDFNSSVLGRVSDSVLALINSVSNINSQSMNTSLNYSGSGFVGKDYSADFSSVLQEIKTLSADIQNNTNAVQNVAAAVSSVEAAVKSQQISLDDSAMAKAVSPLLSVAQNIASTSSTIQSIEQYRSTYLNAIVSSINAVDASVKSAAQNNNNSSNVSMTGALTPLINSVQNLANTVEAVRNLQQHNSSAISEITNAVKSVEAAVKSLDTGSNYDIDINQQGFVIQKKSDAELVARNTAAALRSGLGNGGV